ncbi:amino acid ABC transporter permease [Mesorhizobium sp. NZP2298]|uniref:amino acid ABC transporter permease n=1 Tax=Mesorhizobium sp. NZP2298 TaxID=2483403 RepID=UPI00159B1BA0|nr:amino acid ABC transporter permease [Mesorhizobium sp. NZP2298]QKC98322.1 amino acid ABC transporter permease [Mesorhizobium sp. NZP2298]
MTAIPRQLEGRRSSLLSERRTFSGPTPPRDVSGWGTAAAIVALFVVGSTWATLRHLFDAATSLGIDRILCGSILLVTGACVVLLLWPALKSVARAKSARLSFLAGDLVAARIATSKALDYAHYTFGFAALVVTAAVFAQFLVANDLAVSRTFLFVPLMFESFPLVLRAFWTNVYIFVVAEVFVLIWGLVVAIARLIPGETARPVRAIATFYTDVFRGMPAIITIYLIGFGLPLSNLPLLKDLSVETYAILALTLTFGAYVAEVYRAGIESIHWSQVAAARSLGLSYAQTMRYVVVPQAVRRIVPPLLNDFIGLQKDTALVNVIGAVDAFNQAKIVASNHFNLSPVTVVAFLFVVITIPQARFVDRMIEKDQRRTRAG